MPYISGGSGGSVSATAIEATFTAAGQIYQGTGANAGTLKLPPGFEIGYTQITTNTNITDTAEGTATALISPGALTFDGGAVLVTFYAAAITADSQATADTVTVSLWEGATQIGRLGTVRTTVVANPVQSAVCMMFRFTPSAASHTYKLAAFATSTTGTPNIVAGAGGVSTFVPAFLRFTKV